LAPNLHTEPERCGVQRKENPMSLIFARYAPIRLVLVATFLGQLGSGCHDDPGTATTGGPDGGSSGSLGEAFCRAARSCCGSAGFAPEPLADCESEFDRQFDFVALVRKGTVKIDDAGYRACVAAFDETARTCSVPWPKCPPFLDGTVASGASCDDVEECVGFLQRPTACVKTGVMPDSGPKSGVCMARPIGRTGDACTSSCAKGELCSSTSSTFQSSLDVTLCREEDGLYCDAMQTCAPIPADGAPCSTTVACGSLSYCDTVCKPRKTSGQACASFSQCAPGLACTNGQCVVATFADPKLCSGDYN
jgi:hypothetical protein